MRSRGTAAETMVGAAAGTMVGATVGTALRAADRQSGPSAPKRMPERGSRSGPKLDEPPDEISVWRIDVVREASRLPVHRARLTEAEHERAARLRREADRARFVIGRSTRRELLARRIGIDPATLIFEEGRHGKPRLPPHGSGTHPHFNSSHSGRWVLHAIADVEVGIDVEEIRPEFADLDDFAWVLSDAERAFVQAAAPPRRAAALATVWVRKEAYVKALGEGLSRSLPAIGIISGADGGRPMLAFDRNPPARQRRWSFADLEIDAQHNACLVHAGPARRFTVHDYRPD